MVKIDRLRVADLKWLSLWEHVCPGCGLRAYTASRSDKLRCVLCHCSTVPESQASRAAREAEDEAAWAAWLANFLESERINGCGQTNPE